MDLEARTVMPTYLSQVTQARAPHSLQVKMSSTSVSGSTAFFFDLLFDFGGSLGLSMILGSWTWPALQFGAMHQRQPGVLSAICLRSIYITVSLRYRVSTSQRTHGHRSGYGTLSDQREKGCTYLLEHAVHLLCSGDLYVDVLHDAFTLRALSITI